MAGPIKKENRGTLAVLFFIIFVCTSSSFAYKPREGNVSATLGPFIYKTNFGRATPGFDSITRTGYGLVALGDINSYGSLEIAAFVMSKTYLREEQDLYIAQRAELVHITMGYRYWINDTFSTSLAFFSAYAMGNARTDHNQIPVGLSSDTSARDKVEYGFELSGQADLVKINRFALVLDGRYSYSVTPKNNEQADHLGVLLGIRYLILTKAEGIKK